MNHIVPTNKALALAIKELGTNIAVSQLINLLTVLLIKLGGKKQPKLKGVMLKNIFGIIHDSMSSLSPSICRIEKILKPVIGRMFGGDIRKGLLSSNGE